MVVSKSAVRRFLEQRFPDSDRAKRFTAEAVDRKYSKLDPQPTLAKGDLWTHQKICVLLAAKHGSYFHVLDMGLGKTAISLALIDHWCFEEDDRALVLVPNTANIEGWCDEVKDWVPHMRFRGVEGTPQAREAAIEDRLAKITCSTYRGFDRLICDHVPGDEEEETKGRMVINYRRAQAVASRFKVVIFDESSEFKSHQSLTFRIARKLAQFVPHRINLSGTPMDKNYQDLWSQFHVIDDRLLGETMGLFREAYFYEKEGYWRNEWVIDSRMEQSLLKRMRGRSISFTQDECLDLPPCRGGIFDDAGFRLRRVTFPEETWEYHNELVESLNNTHGNLKLLDSTYTRMRQLTSGYLSFKDPEGERHEIVFKENPKIDALVSVLQDLPVSEQVIVVHHYQKTGSLIAARLKSEKISHSRLYGGTKDKRAVVRRFKQGKDRVLVSSKSGAFGHNFQCARYIIFFESPDSALVRRQIERRIRRPGQNRVTYCIDLVVRNSIDLKILRSIAKGKSLYDTWMRAGKVKWRRKR